MSFYFAQVQLSLFHSVGSLNDITVFLWGEGSAWASRHLYYLALLTWPFLLCCSFGWDRRQACFQTSALGWARTGQTIVTLLYQRKTLPLERVRRPKAKGDCLALAVEIVEAPIYCWLFIALVFFEFIVCQLFIERLSAGFCSEFWLQKAKSQDIKHFQTRHKTLFFCFSVTCGRTEVASWRWNQPATVTPLSH